VLQTFRDKVTEDIFDGTDSAAARKRCPKDIWPVARRKMDQVNRAIDLNDLSAPPGNRLEKLKGDRKGQSSIRLNQQYRVCFRWEDGDAYEVEIVDYH
jgi:proteic killer suppression protein